MKNTYLCISILLLAANITMAQNSNKQKQATAPDAYQEAIKSTIENKQLIEDNKYQFDTTNVKQKEIDFSQDNAQTFLKLYLLNEQQSGDTTNRFGIKITEKDIPRK